jgi:hypothetical protein
MLTFLMDPKAHPWVTSALLLVLGFPRCHRLWRASSASQLLQLGSDTL